MSELDATFPTRVLQVVTGAGIGTVSTDASLTGSGSVASPLSVVGSPFASAYGGPVARKGWSCIFGGGSPQNIQVPADAVAGDLLLLLVQYTNSGTFNTPAGWNVLESEFSGSAFAKVYSRTMQAGDSSFSLSWSTGYQLPNAVMIALTKTSGTPAVDQHAGSNGGGSQTGPVCEIRNGVTPTVNPSLVVLAFQGAQTWRPSLTQSQPNGLANITGWSFADPYGSPILGGVTSRTPWRILFAQRTDKAPVPQFSVPNEIAPGIGAGYNVWNGNFS